MERRATRGRVSFLFLGALTLPPKKSKPMVALSFRLLCSMVVDTQDEEERVFQSRYAEDLEVAQHQAAVEKETQGLGEEKKKKREER